MAYLSVSKYLACVILSSPSHSAQVSPCQLEPDIWSEERPCDRTSGGYLHLDVDKPLEVNSSTAQNGRPLGCAAPWRQSGITWWSQIHGIWSEGKCAGMTIAAWMDLDNWAGCSYCFFSFYVSVFGPFLQPSVTRYDFVFKRIPPLKDSIGEYIFHVCYMSVSVCAVHIHMYTCTCCTCVHACVHVIGLHIRTCVCAHLYTYWCTGCMLNTCCWFILVCFYCNRLITIGSQSSRHIISFSRMGHSPLV